MEQESLPGNTLRLKHLIVAELVFLGISLWLVMAMRSDSQVPLVYQSTFMTLFAILLIGCLPMLRLPELPVARLKLGLTMMIVASVTATAALCALSVFIPISGMKTLFSTALLAALAGTVCAGCWKVISTARKSS